MPCPRHSICEIVTCGEQGEEFLFAELVEFFAIVVGKYTGLVAPVHPALPEKETPVKYSLVNQMLPVTLLRSIAMSFLDDVPPSSVKPADCLPTFIFPVTAWVPSDVAIG